MELASDLDDEEVEEVASENLISLYCGIPRIFFCILRLNYSQVDRRV